jgi:hypothetical protein
MSGHGSTPSPLFAPTVHALQQGHDQARRRARRRRFKNMLVSVVMFGIAVGAVATAGYFAWQFYGDEQRRNSDVVPAVDRRTTDEMIDDLGVRPRWNGPGAPAFGVGND